MTVAHGRRPAAVLTPGGHLASVQSEGHAGQVLADPGQSPACVASTHLLLGMALRQLGKIEQADLELEQGRAMVQNRFKKKLESGDDKTGKIEGWIVTPILLHEAELLSNTGAWLQSDDSE